MVKFVNRAKMLTGTLGTGDLALGATDAAAQSFADAGVLDGDTVAYVIEENANWEIGTGIYSAAGPTLSRIVSESSNADALLDLQGTATVFLTARAEDLAKADHTHDGTYEPVDPTILRSADIGTSVQEQLTAPDAPTLPTVTTLEELVSVSIGASPSENIDRYELWSNANDETFRLIKSIPSEDFDAIMTVLDDTIEVPGNIEYRAYAVRSGLYSEPATQTHVFELVQFDVSNMSVVPEVHSFQIEYDLPTERFLDSVEIYHHADASLGNLLRSSASKVYEGKRDSFTYDIDPSNMDDYHQFWVECVAKTLASGGQITYVGGRMFNSSTLGLKTIDLNGTLTGGLADTPATDDIIIMVANQGGVGISYPLLGTGVTEVIHTFGSDLYDVGARAGWKKEAGDLNIAYDVPSGGTESTAVVMVFRGVNTETPIDAAPVTSQRGSNTGEPPAITHTPATSGATVIYCGGNTENGGFRLGSETDLEAFINAPRAGSSYAGCSYMGHIIAQEGAPVIDIEADGYGSSYFSWWQAAFGLVPA